VRGRPEAWLLSAAFTAGLIPDVFLRWVAQQSKRLVGGGDRTGGPFAPSDLQRKITGMSFWQADRLAEEGIESVQDLAMKDIPDLLIRTRFDPALIFSWVDHALLWNQAGVQSLSQAVEQKLSKDLLDIDQSQPPPLSRSMLENIINGLRHGPNLRYVRNYWNQVSGIE